MKTWHNWLVALVFVAIGLAWGAYEVNQEDLTEERGEFAIKIMNIVSEDWNPMALGTFMPDPALRGEEEKYAAMFQRASDLGEFAKCDNLKLGEFKEAALSEAPFNRFNIEKAQSAAGKCVFENGSAMIILGYVEREEKRELLLLVVDGIQLNQT